MNLVADADDRAVLDFRHLSQHFFNIVRRHVQTIRFQRKNDVLLDSNWDVVAGRRRRLYRLTPAGERHLAREAREWRLFSGSVALVLGS